MTATGTAGPTCVGSCELRRLRVIGGRERLMRHVHLPIIAILFVVGLCLAGASDALALSDSRAYELVSPTEKNAADVNNPTFQRSLWTPGAASSNGEEIVYYSSNAFAEAEGSIPASPFLGTRAAGGWTTRPLTPPLSPQNGPLLNSRTPLYSAFAEDLSTGVLQTTGPGLAPGASGNRPTLYERSLPSSDYQLVTTVPPPNRTETEEYRVESLGASRDLSQVVFSADDTLIPGVPDPGSGSSLFYEESGGTLRLVSALPDGTAAPQPAFVGLGGGQGGLPESGSAPRFHGISELNPGLNFVSHDGARVFWTDFVGGGQVYLREDATTTTPIPGGAFSAASADGSRVFVIEGGVLNEYNLETKALTALTGSVGVNHVLAVSDDGSYVYYTTAEGLFLFHSGSTTQIAPLASEISQANASVTPDGQSLVVTTTERLTGYDNEPTDPSACDTGFTPEPSGLPCPEVFRYSVAASKLTCISCNPAGVQPFGGSAVWPPGGAHLDLNLPRYLSANGRRLFFDSVDSLVPEDKNGRQDVYEWEQAGEGGCTAASPSFNDEKEGCLYLVSSGTDGDDSWFIDATPSGNDVFFTTRARLTGGDTDNSVDLYDARVDGGFEPVPVTQPCTGEACKPPPSATVASPSAASAAFSGAGNALPPPNPVAKPKPKPLTRAQKLARALAACKKKPRRAQHQCERQARKRFGAKKASRARARRTEHHS